jgi:hypothetical protein
MCCETGSRHVAWAPLERAVYADSEASYESSAWCQVLQEGAGAAIEPYCSYC